MSECVFFTRKLEVIFITGLGFALIYIISEIPLTSMELPGYKKGETLALVFMSFVVIKGMS